MSTLETEINDGNITEPKSTMKTTLRIIVEGSGRRQDWLAERLGVTPAAMSKWVNGVSRFPLHAVRQFASAVGVPVETIIDAAEKAQTERKANDALPD